MAKQNYTIIVVPSTGRQIRKVHIPSRYLYSGIIGFAAIFLIGFGSLINYASLNADMRRIQQENAALQADLSQSKLLTDKLTKKISTLARLSAQLKAAAGIEKFASRRVNNTKLGMGGVSMPSITNPAELLALEKKAELLEKNLVSLQSYFQKYRPFTTPSIFPTNGSISSWFGSRRNPFTGLADFHEGMDISNSMGTPVLAPADGTVVYAGYKGTFGLTVELQHDDEITTLFGHLGLLLTKPGQRVNRGQKIGLMGTSGMSTGPHLHYEVRVNNQPVNPRTYLPKKVS